MARQLALIESRSDEQWRLDDATREVGRKGVANARRILSEATAAAATRTAA